MACTPRHRSCSAHHQQLCEDYWAARHAAELAREYETCHYRTEMAEYGPIITFKQWLIGNKRGGVFR